MKGFSGWTMQTCGALLAVVSIAALASTAGAQTVEELIAKNLKAAGGREALLGLKALERKGDVSVDGTFGQMDGTVQEISIPWKKARRSLDLAVFVQDDGYNGTVAWRDGMMGIQELEGEEANQIKQAVELNPFVKIAERETKAEKLDDETVEDIDFYVIQLSPKEKPQVKIFIDKQTDQIARTTLTQNHPQFGMVEIIIEHSDYEQFGPVKLPTKTKVQLGEVFEFETVYTDTKVDGTIDEALFEKPAEAAPEKAPEKTPDKPPAKAPDKSPAK